MNIKLRRSTLKLIKEYVEESFIDAKIQYSEEVNSLSALRRDSPKLVFKSGQSAKQKMYAVRIRGEIYVFNEDAWHVPEKIQLSHIHSNWRGLYAHITKGLSQDRKHSLYAVYGLHNDGDDRMIQADFSAYAAATRDDLQRFEEKLPPYMKRDLKSTLVADKGYVENRRPPPATTLSPFSTTLNLKDTVEESLRKRSTNRGGDLNMKRTLTERQIKRLIRKILIETELSPGATLSLRSTLPRHDEKPSLNLQFKLADELKKIGIDDEEINNIVDTLNSANIDLTDQLVSKIVTKIKLSL